MGKTTMHKNAPLITRGIFKTAILSLVSYFRSRCNGAGVGIRASVVFRYHAKTSYRKKRPQAAVYRSGN